MLLSKKKLYKIKKSKNQSQKKYNKKRKKKKKGRKRRSFSKRKKHLNLKNTSLKFRIKNQKAGGNRIDFQLIFLTSQNGEGNNIMKLINFIVPLSEFENFLNQIPLQKFINMIDSLSPGQEDKLPPIIQEIKLLDEQIVTPINFEHVGKVVNIYNYNAIKHILLRKTPSDITGLKILDALKKYIMLEGDPSRRVAQNQALELANAVFSDVDSATGTNTGPNSGDTTNPTTGPTSDAAAADSTVVDSGEQPPPIPPRPPRQNTNTNTTVVDVAGDGSVRKSDDSPDNDRYRGDGDRMDTYIDYVDKTPTQTTTNEAENKRYFFNRGEHKVTDTKTTVGKTPWKQVPLSLGAPDPLVSESVYPHNLAFEISAREGNDGWTNINILDSGDGPLTVDAFNDLLLKKYKYKKANRKKGEKTVDDDIDEVFGTEEEESDESEEEDEAVKSDEGDGEDETLTINEGDVEIQASPSGNTPDPGLTIVIEDEGGEETETRIVIESGPRGSDGVLLGGGKIMRGGNRTKYRLHLDKPLLYKYENPKTRIEGTDKNSLKKMHGKFESQLKNKYPGDFDNIKDKFNKLTMEDIIKIQNKDAAHISQIKQKAKASIKFTKTESQDSDDETTPVSPSSKRPEISLSPEPEPEP